MIMNKIKPLTIKTVYNMESIKIPSSIQSADNKKEMSTQKRRISSNDDYDLPSKLLVTELQENEDITSENENLNEKSIHINDTLTDEPEPQTYNEPMQSPIDFRLDQIELRLEAIESKLDSFLNYMQELLNKNESTNPSLVRNVPQTPSVKVEIDTNFVPPALPIVLNEDILSLNEKCRSDPYYMEQLVLVLLAEANVFLLDSKCEKKLVRGFMEILFSYDLLENYTLSGAAGFNGK